MTIVARRLALCVGLVVPLGAAAQQRVAAGPSDDLWQITRHDGSIVWDLHLVRLAGDTLVFRQDSVLKRYPLMDVDELRLVRAGEHEIGPVAAGGRYDGAPNGASDMVYSLTLLSLAERRQVVQQLLAQRGGASSP